MVALAILAVSFIYAIGFTDGALWDFSGFYDAARRVASGEIGNIYDVTTEIGGRRPLSIMPYRGTPIGAVVLSPLASLELRNAMLVMKAGNAVAILLAVASLVWCYLPHARREGDAAGFVLRVTLSLFVFLATWAAFRVGGQTTPFAFLALAAGYVALQRDRPWLVAACLVATFLIKPGFAIICFFAAILLGPRVILRCAALGTLVLLASLLLFGVDLHMKFADSIRAATVRSQPWLFNSGLLVIFENLKPIVGDSAERVFTIVGTVVRLGLVLMVGRLLFMKRDTSSRGVRFADYSTAIVVGLAVPQTIWEHYLVLLLIPLIPLLAVYPSLSRPTQRLVLVTLGAGLLQHTTVTEGLAALVPIETVVPLVIAGLLKAVPLATMLALVGFRRKELVQLPV